MSGNTAGNPANFANRPHEEVAEIGRKGGQSSHHGGFASMDPDKQVRYATRFPYQSPSYAHANFSQHDIASKGGHASGGSFEKGSERAKDAGHKGGMASGGSFEPGSERAREAGHKGGVSSHPGET